MLYQYSPNFLVCVILKYSIHIAVVVMFFLTMLILLTKISLVC